MSYFCNTARIIFTIWHMQSTKSRVLMNSDVKYGYSIITHFLVVQTLPHNILHSCLHLEINRLVAAVNKRGCKTWAGAKHQTECGMNREMHTTENTPSGEGKKEKWSHYLFKSTWKLLRNTLSWTLCVSKKFPELFIPKLFIKHHHGTTNSHAYPPRARQPFFRWFPLQPSGIPLLKCVDKIAINIYLKWTRIKKKKT